MKKSNTKKFIAVLLCALMLMTSLNLDNIFYAVHNEDGKTIDSTISSEDLTESVETTETIETTVTEVSELTEDELAVEVTSLDELANEVTALSQEDNLVSESIYATKRLIVLSDTSEFDTMEASFVVSYDNLYILSYETVSACKKAYKSLSENKNIISVEIDSVMETEDNDSAEASQLTETDTELKKYLDSLEASKEIKVAILDTGIDTTNETFKDRVIDLEINLSSSGEENSISDDNGHGTEMATIIANNTSDCVKLMPIKVANADGKATVLNTYLGIQKAIENGADIINISMNTYKSETSQVLTNLINEATDKGIVVVVSAGNNSTDTENITPANIDSAIVVSAIDNSNNFADYSNYGETVDYCSYGTYGDKTGTSYAAASVTGILADTLSKELDASILDQYAIDLGDEGKDIYYGNGLINIITQNSNEPQVDYGTLENDFDKNYNILNIADTWEGLPKDTFQKYIDNSEPYEIGYFLSKQSEEKYNQLLKQYDCLSEEIDIIPFDTSNEDTITCKFYEFCRNEYKLYSESLKISGAPSYTTTTGYFSLNVNWYNGNTASCRVNFTLPSSTSSNKNSMTGSASSGSGKIWFSNKSTNWGTYGCSFKISEGHMAQSSDDKTSGDGRREILRLTGSYTLPAYCYASSSHTNIPAGDYGRLGFYAYKTTAAEYIGDSTLYETSATTARTDDFEIQALQRQCGIKYSDDTITSTIHGILNLNINRNAHTVTLHNGTGIASTSGGGTYYYGDSVTVSAILLSNTAQYTYGWSGWYGYSSGTLYSTAQMYTFTMPDSNYNWIAKGTITEISQPPNPPTGSYTVTCYDYLTDGTTYLGSPGSTTRSYGASISGSEWGTSSPYDNAQYTYHYSSCTTVNPVTGNCSVKRYWTRSTNTQKPSTDSYTVTCYDYLTNGTYLGSPGSKTRSYGASISGSEWGTSSPYNNSQYTYYYSSCTTVSSVTENCSVKRYWTRSVKKYTVTYIDVVDSVSGKQLGKTTKSISYGTTVRGSDLGGDTTDNKYYTGYYYVNDTSATVTGNKTVYRIFKLATVDKKATISWVDKSNAYGSRPKNVVLKVMNGNTVVKTVTLSGNNSVPASTDTWTYTFASLQKYNLSTGKEINYTLVEEQPASLRGELEYNVSYSSDTWTVTNTTDQPKEPENPSEEYGVTITGTITWLDENDKYHFRPETVVVELYQNGKLYDSQTVTGDSYTFTGLDMINFDKTSSDYLKKYEYTIVEKAIDNYSTTYTVYDTSSTEKDSAGNAITTTTLHSDITNTFTPSDDTIRFGDNQLTMKTTFLNQDGKAASDSDFKAIDLNKDTENVYVTLKQMDMSWKAVDAQNGKYVEQYADTYSGNEYNLILTGEKVTELNDLLYGKYEIVVLNDNDFKFKNIEELSTKNVKFTEENGKYYVTYSYEYEEAKEDLNVNVTLDAWRGYTSSTSIKNFFKVTK